MNHQDWKGFGHRASTLLLVATVWTSLLLFGLYILAFYLGERLEGNAARWNEVLPGLYVPGEPRANTAIGLHFATGGLILVLGFIQLLTPLRRRFPAVHRWTGRVYIAASLAAAAGGLAFIALRGTIGGTVMDIGFTGYGVLMATCAVQAWRFARAGQYACHRAWALRLFALAIGSWLYRMDYGFWMLATGGIGHTSDFTGPFDRIIVARRSR